MISTHTGDAVVLAVAVRVRRRITTPTPRTTKKLAKEVSYLSIQAAVYSVAMLLDVVGWISRGDWSCSCLYL